MNHPTMNLFLLLVASSLLLAPPTHQGPVRLPMRTTPLLQATGDCVTYKDLITKSMMTISLSYLADNPRGEDSPIKLSQVVPFTASRLFDVFYKGKASAVEFEKCLMTFIHAQYLNDVRVDRVQFRKNLYKAAKVGSMELGREIMSELVLMIVGDYTDSTKDWRLHRCLPSAAREAAQMAVTIEFAR